MELSSFMVEVVISLTLKPIQIPPAILCSLEHLILWAGERAVLLNQIGPNKRPITHRMIVDL